MPSHIEFHTWFRTWCHTQSCIGFHMPSHIEPHTWFRTGCHILFHTSDRTLCHTPARSWWNTAPRKMWNTPGQSDIRTQWAARPFGGCRQAQQVLRMQGLQGQGQGRSAERGGGGGRQGRRVGEPPGLHPKVMPRSPTSSLLPAYAAAPVAPVAHAVPAPYVGTPVAHGLG